MNIVHYYANSWGKPLRFTMRFPKKNPKKSQRKTEYIQILTQEACFWSCARQCSFWTIYVTSIQVNYYIYFSLITYEKKSNFSFYHVGKEKLIFIKDCYILKKKCSQITAKRSLNINDQQVIFNVCYWCQFV